MTMSKRTITKPTDASFTPQTPGETGPATSKAHCGDDSGPLPDDDGARPARTIHEWFSLSYANYLVLPLAALQSMPREWQVSFVKLLDELNGEFGRAGVTLPSYLVRAVDTDGRFTADPVPYYRRAPNLFQPHQEEAGDAAV